jgi:uncharacterized protein YjbI with pentapeptide repeats
MAQLNPVQWEPFKNVAALFGAGAALVAILSGLAKAGGNVWPFLRTWRDRRTLRLRLGADLYDAGEITRATTLYIQADFQSVDPSGGEDMRRVVGAREPLFATADRLITEPGQYKFVMILADSGMGKTSFLLNYYAYRWRSRRRRTVPMALIPLNRTASDEWISAIPPANRRETVLLLDALDEDRRAIADHRKRIADLIALASDFRTVFITCRTQFFPRQEEIPAESGVMKIGSVRPNESKEYPIHKLYLAPFTDAQVVKYLRRRYPWYRRSERKRAGEITRIIPDLVARPLLLAHIEDLVQEHKTIKYSFQAYEEMVEAWLNRESAFASKDDLRKFSERLAVDLFVHRASRQMERIPGKELEPLAKLYGIPLEDWQLRGRSLLNADSAGNYKFAHRSIMEYLFAKQVLRGPIPVQDEKWTDLIKRFVVEMIRAGQCESRVRLPRADLSWAEMQSFPGQGADLEFAKLMGSDLKRANLREAKMRNAKLVGANASGADLRQADLGEADLESCDLSGADLTSADLTRASLRYADLTGAVLSKTILIDATLSGARGVKKEQLDAAIISGNTTMPEIATTSTAAM